MTPAPQRSKFDAIVGLVPGLIDTIRGYKGLPGYYQQPQPQQVIQQVPTRPRPAPDDSDSEEGSKASGGIRFTKEGLKLGGDFTLSPMMLLLGGVGLFLLFKEPPRRR